MPPFNPQNMEYNKETLEKIGYTEATSKNEQNLFSSFVRFYYNETIKVTFVKRGKTSFHLGGFKTVKGCKNVWCTYEFDSFHINQYVEYIQAIINKDSE